MKMDWIRIELTYRPNWSICTCLPRLSSKCSSCVGFHYLIYEFLLKLIVFYGCVPLSLAFILLSRWNWHDGNILFSPIAFYTQNGKYCDCLKCERRYCFKSECRTFVNSGCICMYVILEICRHIQACILQALQVLDRLYVSFRLCTFLKIVWNSEILVRNFVFIRVILASPECVKRTFLEDFCRRCSKIIPRFVRN